MAFRSQAGPAFSHVTDRYGRRAERPRLVLVATASGYRLADFVTAARAMEIDVVVATDGASAVGLTGNRPALTIDFTRPEWSAARIARLRPRPHAVLAIEDAGVVVAALAAHELGLPANPRRAVEATRDKALLRGLLAAADVPQPPFAPARPGEVARAAAELGFPAVVKPRSLSAGRGVIRVDDAAAAAAAERRVRAILADHGADPETALVVERFVPGPEISLDGVLVDGDLEVLAIMDKPEPMNGPYFPETMFVSPSRLPTAVQTALVDLATAACRAIGLVEGPIHAEARIADDRPRLIELAARPIGGLCGRALTFGLLGERLETVLIRAALGLPRSGHDLARPAVGVVMIPVPRPGVFTGLAGIDAALAVPGITDVETAVPVGRAVRPLPEGDRTLGFLFATGGTPEAVEDALREAAATLVPRIEPGEGTTARCQS